MAVNTTEIGSVYDMLMGKAIKTLVQQYDANRLDNATFGQVMSNAIIAVIQNTVMAVQNQPKIDAEISATSAQASATSAQSTADTALKAKQGLLIDAQASATSAQASATSAQSTADTALKAKQGLLIDAQANTEVEKKLLTTRQKTAYDDNIRVKEAEMLANIAGMMGAGGATFSTADSGSVSFLSTMYSKIDAITP